MNNCPNCNTELKNSMFKKVYLINEQTNNFINEYNNSKKGAYCSKCYQPLHDTSVAACNKEMEQLRNTLSDLQSSIPIVSSHSPRDWDYSSIGIATGQSVTGTGIFTELSAAITDFMGTQSSAMSAKIRIGEKSCFQQLRRHTLTMGGNAILALDIDYSEVGNGKGMIMVCMTGTVVNLKNDDKFDKVPELTERLKYINELAQKSDQYISNQIVAES